MRKTKKMTTEQLSRVVEKMRQKPELEFVNLLSPPKPQNRFVQAFNRFLRTNLGKWLTKLVKGAMVRVLAILLVALFIILLAARINLNTILHAQNQTIEELTNSYIYLHEELMEHERRIASLEYNQELEIEAEIRRVFGSQAENALKIARCESQMNPEKIGDQNMMSVDPATGDQIGDSIGLFQIRTGGTEKNGAVWNRARANGMTANEFRVLMGDYRENIKYAHSIHKKSGWSPWTCATIEGIK